LLPQRKLHSLPSKSLIRINKNECLKRDQFIRVFQVDLALKCIQYPVKNTEAEDKKIYLSTEGCVYPACEGEA